MSQTATKLTLTKKKARNPKKTTSSLAEKLETPSAITARKKPGAVRDNTFSLIDRSPAKNVPIGPSIGLINKNYIGDLPLKRNNFIVRLKVNKVLYQQVFGEGFKPAPKKTISPLTASASTSHEISGFDDVSNISDINFELSQEKNLEIPEIYPLTDLDIQPEKVSFKQLSDIDVGKINQKLNQRNLSNKKIHLILASFKNKSWPNSSPYDCWNCGSDFKNAPVGIPSIANTQSDDYQDTYYLEGNFCSFNCAARYLYDTRPTMDSQLGTIYEIMNYLYNEVNDFEEYTKIKLAPERICLKRFGGHLTLEEYRKNHLTDINYKVFKTPLVPALYQIQETIDFSNFIGKR